MSEIDILSMAGALARHSEARHRLVAQNVANADTPGYRSRDLPAFETVLRETQALRATRAGHVDAAAARVASPVFDAPLGAESPNGNDVSLPEQVARATEAMGAHDKAVSIYGKTIDILRLALGRG